MVKLNKAIKSAAAIYLGLLVYTCLDFRSRESNLARIRELYDYVVGTNAQSTVNARLIQIGNVTYHILAFEEKGEEVLEIEQHVNGRLERKFSDKWLDGCVEYEPKPTILEEKRISQGKTVSYSFAPAKNPLECQKEYLETVERVLANIKSKAD